MLLWRMRSITAGADDRVECHLVRRDMEYRLSLRRGKTVVVQETHRTPTAAAERAEDLRRRAIEGGLPSHPPQEAADSDSSADKSEQALTEPT